MDRKCLKDKNCGIRRIVDFNNGVPIKVVAIIGQVRELLEKEIIFPDNTADNFDKFLSLECGGDVIREFDSLEEAKAFYI